MHTLIKGVLAAAVVAGSVAAVAAPAQAQPYGYRHGHHGHHWRHHGWYGRPHYRPYGYHVGPRWRHHRWHDRRGVYFRHDGYGRAYPHRY